MKVKLDENLGTAGAEVLAAAGFDVATAAEQELTQHRTWTSRKSVRQNIVVSLRSTKISRILSGTLRSSTQASSSSGCRGRFRLPLLERALALVVEAATRSDVRGRLWIAEVDRIREYQEREE